MTVITTARLTLRPHIRADFEDYAALWATDRSIPMGGPLDRDGAWGAFCSDVAQETLGLGQAFAVRRTADDAHVGQVALQHPPSFPERELGWMLYEGFEGQGYAREATQAALDYAFGTLGWDSFVSYISPENTASIRLAEAIGGVRDMGAPAPEKCDVVYRHTRPEAQA